MGLDLDRGSLTAHRWLRNCLGGLVKETKEHGCQSWEGSAAVVQHLVDGKLDTSWEIKLTGHGTVWVVCEFPEAVELSAIRFFTQTESDSPKDCQLYAAPAIKGPWERVTVWEGEPRKADWCSPVRFQPFQGLFWRLEISSVHSGDTGCLRQIEFFGRHVDSSWKDTVTDNSGEELPPSQVLTDPRAHEPQWVSDSRWFVAPLEAHQEDYVHIADANKKTRAGRSWVWCRFPDEDSLAIEESLTLTLGLSLSLTVNPTLIGRWHVEHG